MTAKPPLERVQESERLLERLMLAIPGFNGYKAKEQRREADQIVRDYIHDMLKHSRDDLMTCFQTITDSGLTESVGPMDRLIAKMDRVAERVNHASYGYTGFFDSVRIEEPDLDRMLAYDTQLVDLARKFSEMTASFRESLTQNRFEEVRNAQMQLDGSLGSLELAFDQRKSIIEGVKV